MYAILLVFVRALRISKVLPPRIPRYVIGGLFARANRSAPKVYKPFFGFTLLELLIASFLISVVVLALWGLFSVYAGLMDAGFRRVEQTQVVRALAEQLRSDLRHAIQDPVGGLRTPRTGAAPVRRFGLWGTSTELRFDVLQPPPSFDLAGTSGQKEAGFEGDTAERLPELRTVYYRFSPPQAPQLEPRSAQFSQETDLGTDQDRAINLDRVNLPGLLRWEKDFETPEGKASLEESITGGSATGETSLVGVSRSLTQSGEQATLPALHAQLQSLYGPQVLYIPEVVELEFRYFDGRSWSSSWDSLSRQALPVAVEVRFRIDPDFRAEGAAGPQDGATQLLQAGENEMPAERPPTAGESFRVVIDIPGSPRFEGPRSPAPAESPQSPPLVTRPVIPPRPLPLARPVEPRPQLLPSDQWMRVSP
ncbi:MAG: prepilin-type N-terminal cleavage/methylation domain-containing protein [Thermoguttaceae bacterium]|nr:prepilin-type N-terminal cleavage/methylation domain-containing protein [Thermoguttaceae bacterium]MDW8079669.1 prepilin-type N-terminal cleavage/methylation domain-containing protein [Thermoguttaceae bacterium]